MDWPVLLLAPTIATLTVNMVTLDLDVMYRINTLRCSTGYYVEVGQLYRVR